MASFTHYSTFEICPSCTFQMFIAFYCWVSSLVQIYYSLTSHLWGTFLLFLFFFFILQIKLLWITVFRSVCRHKFSFFWGKWQIVQLLGCMVSTCMFPFKKLPNNFPKWQQSFICEWSGFSTHSLVVGIATIFILIFLIGIWASLVAQTEKNLPAMWEIQGRGSVLYTMRFGL